MDVRRALRKASGAACLAASLLITRPSEAVEYGFSEYFLGLTIPMSGYIPPPGVYFSDTFLLYNATRSSPSPSVNYHLVFDIAQVGYFLDTEVFGATPGFVAIIPFLGARNSFPSLHESASLASISETDYSAVLGWHAGDHNWSVSLTDFAPTGNYDPGRLVQTGLNRPALDIKGAYTFLSLQTGTEISGGLGMIFNALNNATNYQSGSELHFEWALNQHFPFGLAAGVGGYFYQQLTDDYGSGDTTGPNRARAAAVGPLLSYAFKAGDQKVDLSGRWFHEFAVENRPRGDSFFASLAFRL
ncbi:MAG: hypothetical protein USCAAHI_00987 [Beijerinckiaceae bacterium]|nr:MAG: hypothetical protein USCAAHI_00987 [Beijerinckiaceae bacterium]